MTIVRRDLSPKYQLAQTLHAGLQFSLDNFQQLQKWNKETQSVVCLSIENEDKLKALTSTLKGMDVMMSEFYEPDIDNQLTSVAFYAPYEIRKKISSLPLALKEVSDMKLSA